MKITAYTKKEHFKVSLSSFLNTGKGSVEDAAELKRIIKKSEFDADKIVESLNNHQHRLRAFCKADESEDVIYIDAYDGFGNVETIRIEK